MLKIIRCLICCCPLGPLIAVAVLLLPLSCVADAGDELPALTNSKLSLSEALRIAAENSVVLKQQRADADAAAASARGAVAQTKASLSATTYASAGDSANILTSSPGVTPQNIFSVSPRGFADQNLMLMVPLLTGGRLQNNAGSARSRNEASQLSVLASRLAVTSAVTENYTNVALQEALVRVAQARLDAEDEQERITQEKVDAGRSAPVELLREQAEQADARQALLAAQNDAALALVILKTTLGISQMSQITISDDLGSLSQAVALRPITLQAALHQAGSGRPEPAAALRRIEAAQAALSAAKGEYAPQVYGVAMADAAAGRDTGRVGYTVGVTASLPLYDGGQRRADVDGATAQLERARADALLARQTVEQEAATAWLNQQTAAAQAAAAGAGVAAAQSGFTLATLRYNAGKGISAERLEALAVLVRAQGTQAKARASVIIAGARLRAATGGL